MAIAGWSASIARDDDAAVSDEAAGGPYRLDSGDKLRIFVYGQPSLSRIYTLDSEGFISVPLIGNLRARGATTRALEAAIRARLAGEFVRDPHVTVDIQQYRPFFILGEVRQAGQYPYLGGLTVDAAVAIAGGYSERANERKVQITRRINGAALKFDASGDAEVRPGDTIFVKERWF
jgi:polysaccharide export outer membrane protein